MHLNEQDTRLAQVVKQSLYSKATVCMCTFVHIVIDF